MQNRLNAGTPIDKHRSYSEWDKMIDFVKKKKHMMVEEKMKCLKDQQERWEHVKMKKLSNLNKLQGKEYQVFRLRKIVTIMTLKIGVYFLNCKVIELWEEKETWFRNVYICSKIAKLLKARMKKMGETQEQRKGRMLEHSIHFLNFSSFPTVEEWAKQIILSFLVKNSYAE